MMESDELGSIGSVSRIRVNVKLSKEDLNYVAEIRDNLIQHVNKLRFMDEEDIMSAITKHYSMVTEDLNERRGITKNLELLMNTLDEVKRYESISRSRLEKDRRVANIRLPDVGEDIGMLIQGMKCISTEGNASNSQQRTQTKFDSDVTDSRHIMSTHFDASLLSNADFVIDDVNRKGASDANVQQNEMSTSEMPTMAVVFETHDRSALAGKSAVKNRGVKRFYETRSQSRKKKPHGGSDVGSQVPMRNFNTDPFSLDALGESSVTRPQKDDVTEISGTHEVETENEAIGVFDRLSANMEERVKEAFLKGARTEVTEDRAKQLNDRKAIDIITYERALKHRQLLEEFKNKLRVSMMSLRSVGEKEQFPKTPTARINPFYAD